MKEESITVLTGALVFHIAARGIFRRKIDFLFVTVFEIPRWYSKNNKTERGVTAMMQQIWVHESRTHLVCVDSYENGVLKGWFHTPYQDVEYFSSLSQFL